MRTSQNICAYTEISAHTQNICLHKKYSLTSKIFAPHPKYLHISKIYAPHLECSRLIICDSNKAAVEISAPYEEYMRMSKIYTYVQNICAKCMRPSENWRPNSYYLGSAESPSSDFF